MIIYCYIAKLGTVTFFTNNSAPNCPSICMYMSKNNTTCIEQLRYFGFWLNNCLYISCSNEMQSVIVNQQHNAIQKINLLVNIIETKIPGSSEMSNYVLCSKVDDMSYFCKTSKPQRVIKLPPVIGTITSLCIRT